MAEEPTIESSPPALEPDAPRLQKWNIGLADFGIFIALLLSTMVVFASFGRLLAANIAEALQTEEPSATLLLLAESLGMQLGLLTSFCAFRFVFAKTAEPQPHPPLPVRQVVGIGMKWLLYSYIGMYALGWAWQTGLTQLGYEESVQEPVRLVQEGGTFFERILLYAMIVVVAPVCEELTFRAGVFRYLHTRLPLIVSLLVSATLFSLIHFSLFNFVSLLVIGMGLAMAYRESGNILSSIAFHATFNTIQLTLILFFLEPQ